MGKVSLMKKAKNKSCVPGSRRAAWEMRVHVFDPVYAIQSLGSVLPLLPCWNTLILFISWYIKSEFSFVIGK